MDDLSFSLPMPPTLNSMYRSAYGKGGVYKSKEANEYAEEVQWILCRLRPVSIPLRLDIAFYFKRDSDIDSRLKSLLDSMQGRVYENDLQIQQMTVTKSPDKTNPRVEVKVCPA